MAWQVHGAEVREVTAEPSSGASCGPAKSRSRSPTAWSPPSRPHHDAAAPPTACRSRSPARTARRLALLHGGWRGLEAGIAEAGVAAVGGGPLAAVGPGAGPCATRWARTWPRRCAPGSATTSSATGTPTCGCAPSGRCGAAGVESVAVAGKCTICTPERYFSHRRDNGVDRAPEGGRGCVLDTAVIRANLAQRAGARRRPASRSWPPRSTSSRTTCRRWPSRGVELVGENRSDALIEKQERFGDLFTWDFIGHVQSRKVRDIAGRVRLIHSVDSLPPCGQIESRSQEASACLLQVNIAAEDTKAGVGPRRCGRVPGRGRAARACGLPRADDDAAVRRGSRVGAAVVRRAARAARRARAAVVGPSRVPDCRWAPARTTRWRPRRARRIVRVGSVLYSG